MKLSLCGLSCALLLLIACSPNASATVWNLNDDWDIIDTGQAGPGIEFGPELAWSVRGDDNATGPTIAATDTSDNYFTPAGCTPGVDCSSQWIAGYAAGTADIVFKTYANRDPWFDAGNNNLLNAERVKPANHNLDPGSGVLDLGDVGVIGGNTAADIVWKAPRNMRIDASFEAYSVGTSLATGEVAGVDPAGQVRVHFLVRDGADGSAPPNPPINPEGEGNYVLDGFVSVSAGGNGREFISGTIAPIDVTAGQELYIKVNPLSDNQNSRNMIGFSKLEVRQVVESFEWQTDASSAWEADANWDALTSPGGTGAAFFNEHSALFGSSITSSRTVTLDDAVSVREIEFDNTASTYAIGGSGSITLVASAEATPDPTQIVVTNGNHELSAKLNLDTDATISAAGGTSLTIKNVVDLGGNDLTLTGAGTVTLDTQVTGAGNIINLAALSTGLGAAVGNDLTSTGTLDFDISLLGGGQLSVGGAASLDGTINVDFLDGAAPSGDITLLSASSPIELPNGMPGLSLSGASGLGLALSGDGSSLLLVAVPEPTTACLALFGCLALWRGRMTRMKIKLIVCLALSVSLLTTSSAEATVWELKKDWDIREIAPPATGIFFGPENAWSVRGGDGDDMPTQYFVDTTSAYFTPAGCVPGLTCTQQYISGYAAGTADAVFKTYSNVTPWADNAVNQAQLESVEAEKPADHNGDPGAGVLDRGDIGAKAGNTAADIVWKAPRNMIIDAEYVAYSVGTHLSNAPPDPVGNTSETRLHFLVRNGVTGGGGNPPINPEGEPDIRVPAYSGVRESRTQKIAPFSVTAGQEVYLKINRTDPDLGGSLQVSHPDRNVIGFTKIEIRELTNFFEWRPDTPGAWTTTTNWDERIGAEAQVVVDYPGDTNLATFNEHKVLFADEISQNRTISLDSSVSVRAIEFDNDTSSFAVTGLGDINLVASSGSDPTELRVTSGNHELQVDVSLATAAGVELGDSSSLGLTDTVDLGGNNLTIAPIVGSVSNDGALNLNAAIAGTGNIFNSATISTGFTSTLTQANLNTSGTLDFDMSPSSSGQLSLTTGSATLAGTINVDFLSGAFAAGDIPLVSTSNALVIPGGIGALSLTGTGIAGLSLALSGDGTDLLLTGGVGVPGDFDGDLDVDGDDFLFWQRNVGDAPNLALWQANYGTGGLAAGVQAVPEPSSVVLLAGFAGLAGVARRRGHVAKSQFR